MVGLGIVARCAGLPISHTAWLIDTSSHNTDVIILYVVAADIAIHFLTCVVFTYTVTPTV